MEPQFYIPLPGVCKPAPLDCSALPAGALFAPMRAMPR
jgi:hypothetical protein